MTDTNVKAAVRARDGFKCRKCGMTDEQHHEKFDTTLHVHRLIPGSEYAENICVTLCETCHGEMPRKAEDVLFKPMSKTGLLVLYFNSFQPDDARMLQRLAEEAKRFDEPIYAVIDRAIQFWLDNQPPDFCI